MAADTFRNTRIIGSGSFIPERIIENAHFEGSRFLSPSGKQLRGSSTEIIEKFEAITGIQERRYASRDFKASDMAAEAAKKAILNSGVDAEEIDYIVVAHNFGDLMNGSYQTDLLPSLGSRVKHKLGIQNPSCIPYDVIFGCPGWLQGLIQAHLFIQSGDADTVLVVGTETLSRIVDPSDRDTMIFADGAGAVVVQAREEAEKRGVLAHAAQSHTAEELEYLQLGEGNHPLENGSNRYIKMQGRKIYEYALTHVPGSMKRCVEKAGIDIDQVSKVLLHQANEKMDEAIVERLYALFGQNEYPESVLPMTIQNLGNSSVATIPTLYDIIQRGKLDGHSFQKGDHLLLASVGAGMNINALIYQV